jgi:hypothetical protein
MYAPTLPSPADRPWPVVRTLVGNDSAAKTIVPAFGPNARKNDDVPKTSANGSTLAVIPGTRPIARSARPATPRPIDCCSLRLIRSMTRTQTTTPVRLKRTASIRLIAVTPARLALGAICLTISGWEMLLP